MTESDDNKNIIEPFDSDKHDRAAFSCGIEQVDNYFRKTANKLAKAGNVRVYVMTTVAGELIGFCATNAHAVDYTDLPKKFARTRSSHGNIPAAYISMIGVDQKYAGNGYGDDLLIDALTRIDRAADSIGIAVVMLDVLDVLDVLDCGDPGLVKRRLKLYTDFGFMPLLSNPLRLYLPIATVRSLLE